MKKILVICSLLIASIVFFACTSIPSEEADGVEVDESDTVFTDGDMNKVKEMLSFLDEKMKEFEQEANTAIEESEINTENPDEFDQAVREIASRVVIDSFSKKYGDSLGEEPARIYFEKTSSTPCGLGTCEYDGIEVMDIEYNFEGSEEYRSKNFGISELILSDVKFNYENDEEEEQNTEIHVVKTTDGELIFTKHPYLDITPLDLKEIDQELKSIEEDVPESEVESAQAEYRASVEETLSKFPELQ
ncbi:hypothetical protein [Planococcus lenghuensis]|uniref:Lipoprotein n=1 Tax=Planococcus lenghuensis TaxID=2213202 RepID=A0A1Q2L5A1_9BACL|nr:hypothetical protein [Planococcus lenghuensis]AQQ55593.1 hypothetical protein B0X71_20690 [Planococcus lenghuensis]